VQEPAWETLTVGPPKRSSGESCATKVQYRGREPLPTVPPCQRSGARSWCSR
jgi:hypothetical protein